MIRQRSDRLVYRGLRDMPGIHAALRSVMTSIDLQHLATVIGGAAASKKAEQPKKLSTRRVGNTTLIGNESRNEMYWESKPF
jgi:hypothetical protein